MAHAGEYDLQLNAALPDGLPAYSAPFKAWLYGLVEQPQAPIWYLLGENPTTTPITQFSHLPANLPVTSPTWTYAVAKTGAADKDNISTVDAGTTTDILVEIAAVDDTGGHEPLGAGARADELVDGQALTRSDDLASHHVGDALDVPHT